MAVTISYGGQRIRLNVGDPQTLYKGPRGPGARATINGVDMKVANWGPDYLSFRGPGKAVFQMKYSMPAFTSLPDSTYRWGDIVRMLHRDENGTETVWP